MIVRTRASVRWMAAVLLAVFPASCYSYQPVAEAPSPGSSVRVRLTAPGALELSEATDEARRTYEGQLVRAGEDTVTISMLQSRSQSEFEARRTLRNSMSIPRSYVQALERRTLSTAKTTLVIGGAAGVMVALVLGLSGGGEGSDPGNGGDGGPVLTRIPIPFIPR